MSKLAKQVRQLPAVAALQEIWAQRPGETDAQYMAFLDWVDQGANRGAPSDPRLAQKWEWGQRALAFERAQAISMKDQNGVTPERQIVNSLTAMVAIETDKILKRAAEEATPVATLKDLLATASFLNQLDKDARVAESNQVDMSKFTTEELKKILEAQELLRSKGGQK